MSRCVVIGGGEMLSFAFAREQLRPDDFVIAADRGLVHADAMGISPHLILGDFDSYPDDPPQQENCILLPREKDDTDMMFAVKYALERGYQEFLLLGAMGGRLDHTLANLGVLRFLKSRGCDGIILDAACRMRLVENGEISVSKEERYPYLSVFSMELESRGVTLRGVKYPLTDATMRSDFPIGCSNEITEEAATVSVKEGCLVVLQCTDSL